MMKLERSMEKKWIFQKNISSSKLMEIYVEVINETKDVDKEIIKSKLKKDNAYKGRSNQGSLNTMGVRFSQMCFYMFGYKSSNSIFVPSQTTINMINKTSAVNKNMLVNLFALQYPHPYSKTPNDFVIYAGRLIIKLLTEKRINQKLYIDEMIWFLPFVKTINEKSYNELVESILEYRKLNYFEKNELFSSVDNYVEVFANCLHEINYYFITIFKGFDVLETVSDAKHNDGKLFKFKHGQTETYRTDRICKNINNSGYIKLNDSLIEAAELLINKFSPFDRPITMADKYVFSKEDWISDLYEIELIEYLNTIFPDYDKQREIINAISTMTYMSKYSSVDGKDFEKALKPVFELFREILNVEIISGAGDTDLLCSIEDNTIQSGLDNIYKINIDGKSRKSSTNLNPLRLVRHLKIHSSKYCIVVAPRFSRGTILDISNLPVVLITADSLARYCSKECFSSDDSFADYTSINEIIINNLGKDITPLVDKLTMNRYGINIQSNDLNYRDLVLCFNEKNNNQYS